MVLSDGSIIEMIKSGELGIEPFDENLVQPASIDLRLGRDFMVMLQGARLPIIEPVGSPLDAIAAYDRHVVTDEEFYYYVYPHQIALCTTVETVRIPNNLLAKIEGKSTLARSGLLVHIAAGFVDPGFEGELTLVLVNMTDRPIKLVPGMQIAQLSFHLLDKPALRPYGHSALGSHYQHQRGATPGMYTKDELMSIIDDAEEVEEEYEEYINEAYKREGADSK